MTNSFLPINMLMLKWKVFRLYQLICPHRHGEESSGRTVPDQPGDKNRPTLVHGELVLCILTHQAKFVLGLLVFQDSLANISLFIPSFLHRYTCCFFPFYPSLLWSSKWVFYLSSFHTWMLPVIIRTKFQLKMLQNSTTLNELLQYQTEVQRIGEKVIIGNPGGGSW